MYYQKKYFEFFSLFFQRNPVTMAAILTGHAQDTPIREVRRACPQSPPPYPRQP